MPPLALDERPPAAPTEVQVDAEPFAALTVMTWNIGYAGLGAGSDFVADGGEHLRPPSREAVEANLAGVAKVLAEVDPDVALMQETAGPGYLTYGIDVIGGVAAALPNHRLSFSADVRSRFIPRRWSLRHGPATLVRPPAAPVELVALPMEPGRLGGIFKRRYHAQVQRLAGANGRDWALVDVHLSAFDEGASTRVQQIDAVIALAEGLYADGLTVIVGGDWNMLLAQTDFPYTTSEEDLSWVHAFPMEVVPEGWRIVADASTPTVRTNEQPYVPGENFTGVIDGFLVSPDVKVESVKTIDLDFVHTDHQPVVARFTR